MISRHYYNPTPEQIAEVQRALERLRAAARGARFMRHIERTFEEVGVRTRIRGGAAPSQIDPRLTAIAADYSRGVR